jgi:RNA polymerase sigma-70 factor (ECF subfamily)
MEMAGVLGRDEGEIALVARARLGDRDAFARLIGPRADRALRTARAILGNETEAHDAAQEALVSAWVNLPKLRDIDRFDAWINRILRNACRDVLRRRRSSRVVDLAAAEAAGDRGTIVADPSGGTIDAAAVRTAFGRLNVDDRTILLLHHLHGLPLEDVARQLGVPIGTAKSRLFGARRALERALETQR